MINTVQYCYIFQNMSTFVLTLVLQLSRNKPSNDHIHPFTETEVQIGKVICPRSCKYLVAESALGPPFLPPPQICALCL